MIRIIGLVMLWSFLVLDILLISKVRTTDLASILFMSIRTIPLILVTVGE